MPVGPLKISHIQPSFLQINSYKTLPTHTQKKGQNETRKPPRRFVCVPHKFLSTETAAEAVEPEMKISIVRVKAQPRKHKAPGAISVGWFQGKSKIDRLVGLVDFGRLFGRKKMKR